MIKNKMRLILIMILCLMFLISCSNKQANIANVNNTKHQIPVTDVNSNGPNEPQQKIVDNTTKDVTKTDYTIKLLKENTIGEDKYYSPDKKNYIRVTLDYTTSTKNYYLNDSMELLDTVIVYDISNIVHNSIYWISNDEVLLTGEYIYNVKDGSVTELKISDFFSQPEDENEKKYEYGGLIYSMNKARTKIAYSFFVEEYNLIYTYDIKTHTYKKIDREHHSERPSGEIFWDNHDNLYLNTFGNTASGWQITKYNLKENTKKVFKDNISIAMMSPDLNYSIIFNDSHKYELLDINEDKTIFTFDNDIISYSLNNESLIYYDCKTNYINIYLFNEDKTITITNFKDIIKPDLNWGFFVNDQEYYTLFIYDPTNNIPEGNLYRISY